jgi:tetratricopeptide (TPR) repeat protein
MSTKIDSKRPEKGISHFLVSSLTLRFFAKHTPVSATPAAATTTTTEADPHAQLSKEERVRLGDEHKVKANELLTKRQWEEAIKEYTQAIEYNPTNAIYHANRALSHQKLGNLNQAIEDAKKAIHVKRLYSALTIFRLTPSTPNPTADLAIAT